MKTSLLYSVSTIVGLIILLQLEFIVAQGEETSVNNEVYQNSVLSKYPDQVAQRRGWMQSAQQMMSGPAGQMMVHFAKELISRSAGNSQVLSLNLTNLLILILLKALIFAAGLIGAGNWSHYGRSRGMDDDVPLLDQNETPLLIGFLAAQGSGQDGCLQRAACQSPQTSAEYIKAARAIIKGSELFTDKIITNQRYSQLVYNLEQAAIEGVEGAPCEMIYHCLLR